MKTSWRFPKTNVFDLVCGMTTKHRNALKRTTKSKYAMSITAAKRIAWAKDVLHDIDKDRIDTLCSKLALLRGDYDIAEEGRRKKEEEQQQQQHMR
eukprot:11858232-Ditylum_brightwellii.AAC.1